MISNLIVNQQKFVLIIDNLGMEQFSSKFIMNWLQEQGVNNIKNLDLLKQININEDKTSIIVDPLSDLLLELEPSSIFKQINQLKRNSNVTQIFLWTTSKNISNRFIIPFLEYMADIIVTFIDSSNLSILTRKSGGSVTNKVFLYEMTNDEFLVKSVQSVKKTDSAPKKPENLGETFKIELSEDDLVARNSVRLPYERVANKASQESKVIYTPEDVDDLDDEDPDDDLYI